MVLHSTVEREPKCCKAPDLEAIHRDFSRASSYVSIAVFDDRIDVRSVGEFPQGIRAEMLSREHPSIRSNPLIVDAFHRTGAVEVWERCTNRVIEACQAHGIAPPEFKQEGGVVTVTFRVPFVLGSIEAPSQPQAGTMSAPWESDSPPGSTTAQLRDATGSASCQQLFGTKLAPCADPGACLGASYAGSADDGRGTD
jgi:hypothetical protein